MSGKTKRISEVPVLEQATEKTNLLVEENGTTSRIPVGTVNPNINPDRHAEYFTITEDGVLSLKPEFRGKPTKDTCPDAISDNGVGNAGSRNAELPEHLVIPEIVGEVAVDGIADGAFRGNMVIKSVGFPKTIKQIPLHCFRDCYALEQVYGVEGVTSVGNYAFQNTNLKSVYLPNLTSLGKSAFCQCSCLTHVNIGKVTEILNDTFYKCRYLSRIESDNLITSVGVTAFANTSRLVNAEFVKNLEFVDVGAFICSCLEYDWSALSNCTFETNATSLQINPTDFWSACTVTECENPMPTVLCQTDRRWEDNNIGTTDFMYGANGCQFFCITQIYSGLNNLHFETVQEIEEYMNAKYPGHLNTFGNNDADIKPFAEGMGMKVTEYSSFNQENLQALYDALAAGKYAILKTYGGSTSGEMTGHVVIAYGLTKSGKIKIANSDYRYYTDRTKGGCTYAVPYKSTSAPTSAFWILEIV